ncbi:hypothetical protein BJX99DRAFT_264329 [Aspergillus californicus]
MSRLDTYNDHERDPHANKVAAGIAQILDKAKVPNVLFGWTGLSLVGENHEFCEIDFVAEDNMIQAAQHALGLSASDILPEKARIAEICFGKELGPLNRAINLVCSWNRFHPVAPTHFHLPSDRTVSLYTKSYMLWWLPDLQNGPPATDNRNLILSTDSAQLPAAGERSWPGPRTDPVVPDEIYAEAYGEAYAYMENLRVGCSGPWTELYPVKILRPRSFIEAVILCWCRDLYHAEGADQMWEWMIEALGEIREPGQTAAKHKLGEQFQPFWDMWHGYPEQTGGNAYIPLDELRNKLLADNKLPHLPLKPGK